MRRRTVSCLLSLVAILIYGSMAAAGPLPPNGIALGTPTGSLGLGDLCDAAHASVSGGGCGESDLAQGTDPGDGNKAQINVDWMVLAPGSYNTAVWDLVTGKLPTDGDPSPGSTVGAVCPAHNCYIYLYQEENANPQNPAGGLVCDPLTGACVPAGTNIIGLSVAPAAPVLLAGVFGNNGDDSYGPGGIGNPGDDLDCGPGNPNFGVAGGCISAGALHPGHYIAVAGGANGPFEKLDDGVTFQPTNANPLREEEGECPVGDTPGDMGDHASPPFGGGSKTGAGSGTCIQPLDPIETTYESGGITWKYLPSKPPHHETPTLFYVSTTGPVYGRASTQEADGTNAGTHQRDADNPLFVGEAVPVPGLQAIPEPTTLVLFGGGLVALGLLRRKMKR